MLDTKAIAVAASLLLGGALPIGARAEPNGAPAVPDDAPTPIDPSGELGEAELRERVQFILGGDARAPEPSPLAGAGTVLGGLIFKAVAGGSGAGQDLAQPSQE